jgi:ABC-type lipoprotein export system ATPase subunit
VIAGPYGSANTTMLNVLELIDSPTNDELWFEDKTLGDNNHYGLYRYRRDHLG